MRRSARHAMVSPARAPWGTTPQYLRSSKKTQNLSPGPHPAGTTAGTSRVTSDTASSSCMAAASPGESPSPFARCASRSRAPEAAASEPRARALIQSRAVSGPAPSSSAVPRFGGAAGAPSDVRASDSKASMQNSSSPTASVSAGGFFVAARGRLSLNVTKICCPWLFSSLIVLFVDSLCIEHAGEVNTRVKSTHAKASVLMRSKPCSGCSYASLNVRVPGGAAGGGQWIRGALIQGVRGMPRRTEPAGARKAAD